MTEPYDPLQGPRLPREPDPREVRADFRAALGKHLGRGAIGLAVALVLGGVGYNTYAIRHTQVSNKPVLRDTRAAADAAVRSAADAARTASRVEDCTTPGRDCYDRAQAQTGNAVAGINTVTLQATACVVALLQNTPEDQALTPAQIAAQMKRCIQGQTIRVSPTQVPSTPLPPTSSPSPSQRPSAPRPTRAPSQPPAPLPTRVSPICIIGICLPVDAPLVLPTPSVLSLLLGTVHP